MTASDQKLESGEAWERGYHVATTLLDYRNWHSVRGELLDRKAYFRKQVPYYCCMDATLPAARCLCARCHYAVTVAIIQYIETVVGHYHDTHPSSPGSFG